MSRELRSLVPFEIAAVIAIALAPIPELIPLALPLMVAGTLSRWIRQRSWSELARSGAVGAARRAAIGALAGSFALAVVVVVGQRSVEWAAVSPVPLAGEPRLIALVTLHVAVTALAAELALRGWIVERVLELSPGSPVLPVFAGALAEAIVTPGDVATRLGAALFGIGLGWIYVAGGRNLVAPICARVAFAVGALAIESFRLV